jgi:DNA-binding Lrp family transcriptional regulator
MYMNMAFDNVCFKGSAVSTSARFVYLCLCKHADNTKQTCFPSLNRIAQIVGKSLSTIKRAVRELCSYGVIKRTARFRKDGGQTSNLYTIVACDPNALTKAPEIESYTQQEIPDQDTGTEDIFFSVSDQEKEPACSCTREAEETKQSEEVEEIDKSVNIEIENTSLRHSSNATEETEKIHIDDKTEERLLNNGTAVLHITSLSRIRETENAGITADQVNIFKALGIKEKIYRLFKNIRISAANTNSFRKNELGGGHR